MIRIIDYGSGNLRSVQKAFERHGVTAEITSDPNCVAEADRLVLPGVGAFSDAMAALRERGLVDPIRSHIVADRPFLGICMGLQLLFETGWEGGRHDGLGVFAGDVARLHCSDGLKVPHMGWNQVQWRDGSDVSHVIGGSKNVRMSSRLLSSRKDPSSCIKLLFVIYDMNWSVWYDFTSMNCFA